MMHRRTWSLATVASPEELADKLTNHLWTLCTAFCVAGHPDYLFVNDSTSEDGAVEYGIVKRFKSGYAQIESITFGWCTYEKALEYIQAILRGDYDDEATRIMQLAVETPEQHGRCNLCV